jgi:hypothetical protein
MENVYSNTNYCGVNANFFYNTSDPEYLSNNYEYLDIYTLGINNHSSIKNHGDVNLIGQNQDGDRGTFIVYDWSCQEKCSR